MKQCIENASMEKPKPYNPKKYTSPAGCIYPALVVPLFIFLFMLVSERVTWTQTMQAVKSPEPALPSVEIPVDTPIINKVLPTARKDVYTSGIGANQKSLIISADEKTKLYVNFDKMQSIKHLWNGSNPFVEVLSPQKRSFPASTHQDTWSNVVLSEMDPFTPVIEFDFSAEPENLHTWMEFQVSLDVLYPVPVSGTRFENTTKHLQRNFCLFVLSRDEINQIIHHEEWEAAKARGDRSTPFLYTGFWPLLGITGGVLLILVFFWLRFERS